MAILKNSYNSWTIDTGDEEVNAEMASQLVLTTDEIRAAINDENLVDTLLSRVLQNRSRAHRVLLERLGSVTA
jgi:hypothetical protein